LLIPWHAGAAATDFQSTAISATKPAADTGLDSGDGGWQQVRQIFNHRIKLQTSCILFSQSSEPRSV